MPLITETYYLSLTQDNRGILRLRCSQDDTLRTVNLKLYNNGSIFVIPSGISASISGVKQNGAVFSKPCTISQNRESVVLQLSSDITNVDGIIVAEIVLNDGEGGRLGTSNFIIQVEKNPIRVGVVQDIETPIEYINDFIEKIQTLTARLNNLITPSGDPSLAEVVDARMGILDSTTYQTLGARLNAEFQRLSNALNGITILESTGDTTDRTSEILSKLNTYGVCKLGKGDFYVSGLVMPEGSHLVGSGKSTRIILPSSITDGYIVKPRSNCIIENISFYGGFTGTHSELIDSSSIATRHCIILDRFNSVSSENVILSNVLFNNFVGSAIIQRYTTGCLCKDVVINMCYSGIDISNASYDGQCTNISMTDTRFGVVQNGSNFIFNNCISKDSEYHIMSDQQNTECTFSSCTFSDSSLETTSKLAYLSNARNGFVFDNCIFDSSLKMGLNACDGIVIKGTNFVGSDTFRIIVSNGRNTLLLITDCIADVEPVVTNAGENAHIISCYLKDGTAWSISEAQDGLGGLSTLAELTDTDISSEQDGQVLIYDGTSNKWVNRTPSDGSVEIEVDNELSSTSENPVQNKVINRAVSELKADLDALEEYMITSETPDSSEFEIGAISSSTGGNVSLSTRIRTRTFLTKRIFGINVLSGYKYAIYAYEDNASNTYKGSWNGSAFVAVTTWLTTYTDVLQLGDCKIRVVIAKSDDSSIDVSDSNNLILNNAVYALNSDMRAVDDIRSELNILEINEKFSNIIDTNLVDESRLIANSYLVNGEVNYATSDYYVSEFIPVYGNNVTGNWYMSSSIAGFAVYNAEFEYLRSGKNVATYVYAQGDAYIRCCFKIDSGYKAFYGDALKAYSAFTTDPNREAKEIKELKANAQSTVRPVTIKYIGDDENCDYATVQDALSGITDDSENKPYIFYIMPGVYASFTMKYTDNTRETARIGGARWISLIGLDVTNTIFFDNRGNYKFSPCEIFTNGVIENITFIDKADVTHFDPYQDRNYAYAVHVDFGKCNVRFNNCKFHSNAGPAVGLGTYKDQLLEFYNCRFESDADGTYGSDGLGALFCHAMTSGSAQSDRTNQRLIIHDSIAVATESLVGSRFAVISGYEGTYSYELQNFGSIGKNGAAVSLTIPDNDMFSNTCFNNVPASLNTIGV